MEGLSSENADALSEKPSSETHAMTATDLAVDFMITTCYLLSFLGYGQCFELGLLPQHAAKKKRKRQLAPQKKSGHCDGRIM